MSLIYLKMMEIQIANNMKMDETYFPKHVEATLDDIKGSDKPDLTELKREKPQYDDIVDKKNEFIG